MLLSKNVITPGKFVKLSRRPCVLRKTVIRKTVVVNVPFILKKLKLFVIHVKPMPFTAAWHACVSNKYNRWRLRKRRTKNKLG